MTFGKNKRFMLITGILSLPFFMQGATLNVPTDHATLPEAIRAATEEDTIVVAPGHYRIDSRLHVDKKLTITSRYSESKEESDIAGTVFEASNEAGGQWFHIAKNATGTRIIGFTFNGNKAHTLAIWNSYTEVSHCRFIGGGDQLSFEGGGGLVSYCYFEGARDDAIDADFSVDWIVEHCTIVNPRDDGIELRFHPKKGPMTTHIIRHNKFIGSGRTGVQLIDYEGDSFRDVQIYGNVFQNIGNTGMDCTLHSSDENVDGSPMVEKAQVYRNIFMNCRNGVTMAPHVSVFNNIFQGIENIGIISGRFLGDGSEAVVYGNVFLGNGEDWDEGVPIGKDMLKVF